MVENIKSRNTWSRVSSSPPVKKIDRRRDQHPGKKFREHLSEKHGSAGQKENAEADPQAVESTTIAQKENATPGSPVKPKKRIDIII